MSHDPDAIDSWQNLGPLGRPSVDAGALGLLPSLARRQVLLERRLGPDGARLGVAPLLEGLGDVLGFPIEVDRFGIDWRGAGLRRPAAVAQFGWPRLATRLAMAVPPVLAHAAVDQLLGFERLPAEGRLQVTPVEWGILSFVFARGLDRLDEVDGPLGPWDLVVDRVGPDAFDPTGLGPLVTLRWRVRVGDSSGTVRLWVPESLLALWLLDDAPSRHLGPIPIARFADLTSAWTVEAGSVTLPRGLAQLKVRSLLLIEGSPLTGTPKNPGGTMVLAQSAGPIRSTFLVRPVPNTAASRVVLASRRTSSPVPRETQAMPKPASTPAPAESVTISSDAPLPTAPIDIPVTLVVELGRVNLPLHRLADLQPGDVVELGRHAREPVELTSGGRLIARGELVQVDTELGVRVTHVFL